MRPASGNPRSSGGDVGEVLDLAHHVVAEVADHPGVERRQLGQDRRAAGGQQLLEGGQDALAAAGRARPGGPWPTPGGRGPPPWPGGAAHERVAAPALPPSTDSSRNPAPRPRVVEGGHRGEGVGHHLGPHRHDGVVGGQRGELLGSGSQPHAAGRPVTVTAPCRRPRHARTVASCGRSRPLPGVAGAVAVLVDQDQQRVAVAVDPDLAHVLAVARRLPLAPVLLAAAAPEPGPPGVQGPAQGLGVHVGDHEDLAVDGVLDHRDHQPAVVERHLVEQRLVDSLRALAGGVLGRSPGPHR